MKFILFQYVGLILKNNSKLYKKWIWHCQDLGNGYKIDKLLILHKKEKSKLNVVEALKIYKNSSNTDSLND